MKFVTRTFTTFVALLLLAGCYLPPVDVGLAVALSSAEQMTLAQSFSLWPNTVQDLYREAREVRFYPALTNSVVPAAGGPLGYFVVAKGDWVSLYYVQLDPLMQPFQGHSDSIQIDSSAVEPFHVVHSLRDVGGEEKIALFRYRPDAETYTVATARNDGTGFLDSRRTDDIATDVAPGLAPVAGGSFAAGFSPAGPEPRFAIVARGGLSLESISFGFNAGGDLISGGSLITGTPPAAPPGFGRVTLLALGVGQTRTIVNVPVDNQFRTYVLYEPAASLGSEYLPLGIAGRLETVLATGEILTRTRDRFVVSGPFGETRGSFPAGDLRFVHEREIEISPGELEWHAVFTLTYWGRIDGDERLFVRVYVVPSARLGSLR